MAYRSVLVHLSDIECGPANRAESPTRADGYEICANSLIRDVRRIIKKHRVSHLPLGLVVTGDIAAHGQTEEYRKAERLLDSLRSALSIPAKRIALIPGNHDVDWEACRRAFFQLWPDVSPADPGQRAKACTLPEKLANFCDFFGRITGRVFDGVAGAMSFDGFSELGLALVGVDTTYPATFVPEDNYGLLNSERCRRAGQALRKLLARTPRLIPVVAMHHCPASRADQMQGETSILRYATEALDRLGKAGFRVVLCGHEHQHQAVDDLRTGWQILSTGSFGLNQRELVNEYHTEVRAESNRYQVVLVDPEASSLVLFRKLQPGRLDDSEWTEDDDCERSQVRLQLHRPQLPAPPLRVKLLAVRNGRPVGYARRRAWVISVLLEGPCEVLHAVRKVTYMVGDHSATSSAQSECFRAELDLVEIGSFAVDVDLEYSDGQRERITGVVPDSV